MDSLGDPSVPLNTADCHNLINLGDHLMTQARADTQPALRHTLPLAYRVPPTFRHALALAYARINLLDDNCLVLAELNGTLPQFYPDERKVDEAFLLLPGLDLIDLSRDEASRWNALAYCAQFARYGNIDFQGCFGPHNPFAQF